MAQFRYIAVETAASSETIEGRMEAPSKSAVVDRLHASGQIPIRVDEVGLSTIGNIDIGSLLRSRRMPARTLSLLTSQLATLLHAGLALDQALGILEDLVDKPREKECLRTLLDRISGGAALSDAMAEQKNVFPDFYVSMIRAGEAGASLEAVLDRLAEFLERTQRAREHVTSALLYPLIVAITCIGSIAVLFVFVVPRFRPLFEQAGDALPFSAQLLLLISDLLQTYWWALIAGPLVLALIVWRESRNVERRRQWERLILKLPLVGDLVSKSEVVRFSRTLGTLLKNGVSLLTALAITRETIGNSVYSDAVGSVIERVKTGKGLAEPVAQSKVFPSLAVHLIRVGEESGRQDEMLLKIADIFEGETRRSIDRMLALMGPALTVGMGMIVAGVIGSILTAVLSVYDLAM
jgi:general secretion pathway protein F